VLLCVSVTAVFMNVEPSTGDCFAGSRVGSSYLTYSPGTAWG
jgi:hypothetical protein